MDESRPARIVALTATLSEVKNTEQSAPTVARGDVLRHVQRMFEDDPPCGAGGEGAQHRLVAAGRGLDRSQSKRGGRAGDDRGHRRPI